MWWVLTIEYTCVTATQNVIQDISTITESFLLTFSSQSASQTKEAIAFLQYIFLVSNFFCICIVPYVWDLSLLLCVSVVDSFLLLRNSPLYEYATMYLSI